MARRTVIPEEQLKHAKERIEKGECTYGEAAKALGIGDMALRGNFRRAGLEVVVPKRRARNRNLLLNEAKCGWDKDLAATMLSRPLRGAV